MKKDEAINLARSLAKLFPGSMANEEQARACAREFMKYEAAQVRAAIDEHHRTREFISFPELYKACAAVPAPNAPTTRQSVPDMTFAQIIRQQRLDLEKRSDHEVILRYWRGDWWRYKSESDRRLESITASMKDGEAHDRLIEAGYSEEQIVTMRGMVLQTHENNEAGYRRKVESHCRSCLLVARMEKHVVDGWVETVFSEPDHFRMCLSELRGDIFAGNAA